MTTSPTQIDQLADQIKIHSMPFQRIVEEVSRVLVGQEKLVLRQHIYLHQNIYLHYNLSPKFLHPDRYLGMKGRQLRLGSH